MKNVNDLLQLRIASESGDVCANLGFELVHHAQSVVEGLRVITQIRYCVILERGCRRSFLQDVYSRRMSQRKASEVSISLRT